MLALVALLSLSQLVTPAAAATHSLAMLPAAMAAMDHHDCDACPDGHDPATPEICPHTVAVLSAPLPVGPDLGIHPVVFVTLLALAARPLPLARALAPDLPPPRN